MYISVLLCTCLIANVRLSNVFVTLLQMLLPVHVASLSAIDTLPCVHIQCLQSLACPCIAAGHWLFSNLLGSHSQWPGDAVGHEPACSCIVVCSHLEPSGEAHHIPGQGDYVVPVSQQVQPCPSLQPQFWYQMWHCICTSW